MAGKTETSRAGCLITVKSTIVTNPNINNIINKGMLVNRRRIVKESFTDSGHSAFPYSNFKGLRIAKASRMVIVMLRSISLGIPNPKKVTVQI